MPSQYQSDSFYMTCAIAASKLSKAVRKQVGAVLVTSEGVIIPGVNGMSSGGSNDCEYFNEDQELVTKNETLHSELNCLLRAAKHGISIKNCKIYVTLSPCNVCSEMLIQAGVKEVIYLEEYRCTEGIDNLKNRAIVVRQFQFKE